MKIEILFIFVLASMFACNDANEGTPKETSLLTLTVDVSYPTDEAFNGADDTDDWIIVHNADGTLLASQNFQNNEELELITDKAAQGDITITHLRYVAFQDGNKSYSLKTYANIEKGKHMVLKGANPLPEKTGKINVTVSDVYAYQNSILTSRLSTLSGGGWNGGTGILDIESDTYSGVTKYVVSVTSGNLFKYKVLENVQPNDTYSLSFDDMTTYEHTATFTFPQSNAVNLFVYGSDPDDASTPNSYLLDMRFISGATTAIVPEYMNSLTNYKTQLLIFYPDYGYEYLNLGSIPDNNSTWPQKSDFNVNEKSLSNFSATSSTPYVWRTAWWKYQDAPNKISVVWNFSSPSGNHKIKELPTEIINAYPALALSNLIYTGTTFYTQSPAFDLFFENTFQGGPEPTGLRMGITINQ